MNTLPIFVPLVLASLLASPAHAETYGEAASDAPGLSNHIKTVPRPVPAASMPASPPAAANSFSAATAAPAAGVEVKRIDGERWRLTAGHLVRHDLTAWGNKSGWQVLWHLPHDWTVPAHTDFDGDFKDAASAVIRTLAENGVVIRGQFYDGNRTLVVSGAGPVTLDPQ